MPPTDLDATCVLEIKTALVEIKGEVKSINERLGGYVPQSCIQHSAELETLKSKISNLEQSDVTTVRWLVGALGLALLDAGLLVLGYVLNHMK